MTKGRRESAHFPNKVLGGATEYAVCGFGLSLSEYGVLRSQKPKEKHRVTSLLFPQKKN